MSVERVSQMPLHAATIYTKEAFDQYVSEARSRPDYQEPFAFAIGIATLDESGVVIDMWHPTINTTIDGVLQNKGSAVVFADAVGYKGGNKCYILNYADTLTIGARFHPFIKDDIRNTIQQHPNIDAAFKASLVLLYQDEQNDCIYKPTLTLLSDIDDSTASLADRWLVERIKNNDTTDKPLVDLSLYKSSPSRDLYKKLKG
ncbi:MAG: hypothetical protein KC582_00560 [Candidatus Magasanikbacteria bacterium]|nr:hypothetical protein [Candidatus Magasanikbacteria bacterium]MCA9389260.1 hypothetical protein [Candidatus Magasanikbacteria bacterium]MCA9390737.1 hypothetical protein [Candidatus Magasanikbacteria bacterium]HPF95106.1 hypothetical protein [bacterium]